MKMIERKSFRQQIIALEKGEHLTISVDVIGYTTIRTYASDLGFAYNRKYSATRNRTNRTYTFTRIA